VDQAEALEVGGFWIVDDSGFPKQGQRSVGVARQDCRAIGQNRGRGRPAVQPRRTAKRQPLSVKALARALPESAYQTVRWREGRNQMLSCRFAAVQVRHAGGNVGCARLGRQQWLPIEWPHDQAAPAKYDLSTLPGTCTLDERIDVAHQRW
jgi:SRSO17 transposase